jgi:DNA-binding transcriptional regulator YiaG
MIDNATLTIYNKSMDPERIKSIRKKHGLGKSALARRIGATYQSVHVWETGKGHPSPVFVMLLTQLEQSDPQNR